MQNRSSKKKLDFNQLAKSIVDDATTEKLLKDAAQEGKNIAAVLLGRMGGLKGGKARADKLSVEERHNIAKKAAQSRWSNELSIMDEIYKRILKNADLQKHGFFKY
jgi:hypothetical protein